MCSQHDDPSQHDVAIERCVICKRPVDPDLAITVDLGGLYGLGLGSVCHRCQDREDRGFEEADEVDL